MAYLEACDTGELGYDGPLYDRFFAYNGRYAWSQSDAYQVFVICIRRILHMTDQFYLVPLSLSYPSSPVLHLSYCEYKSGNVIRMFTDLL